MNTRSIHFRLILWYGALIVAVALVFSIYIYQGVYGRLYKDMEQTLTRRSTHIAEHILPRIYDKPPRNIAADIHDVYSPEANNRFIRIIKADGSILYVSGKPKDSQFGPDEIPVPTGVPAAKREEKLAHNLTMLMVAVPVNIEGQSYTIEMGAPTDGIQRTLRSLVITLLSALPIVILIAASGVYVVVRYSLRPVEHIRATAEHITFGNLKNRLPVAHTGDELEHLSLTLNQMLERLDDAYQQSTRFSADASHELRTPLSFMLGELETLAEDAELPESYRERIGSVFEETERLSRITENLFALSRLDAGEAKIMNIRFDLASLVQSTTEQMTVLAEEKNITIDITAIHPAPMYGDPARLKQVVINLLDNAIKYTPNGGTVSLKVSSTTQKTILEVTDTGTGISAEDLPHIFERFYRADKARSREAGGAGLGLSIVRSICIAHGGSVDVESTEGEYTKITIELPIMNTQEQSA